MRRNGYTLLDRINNELVLLFRHFWIHWEGDNTFRNCLCDGKWSTAIAIVGASGLQVNRGRVVNIGTNPLRLHCLAELITFWNLNDIVAIYMCSPGSYNGDGLD